MPSWFHFRAAANDCLTIDITDEIGCWGVSAKAFADALAAAGQPKTIVLNLDSPGGDCCDGFTIYDALKNSGAEVTVNITGMAASMASVIMLAGQTIKIAENGRVMIHRVTAGAMGNADELDAAAKIAAQFEDRIVALYIGRTGQTEAQIRDWMKSQQGTWFFGQDAIDAGFADALITGTKAKAFKNEWAHLFTMLPAALFDITAPATAPRAPDPSHMKALLALASLVGITVKGDETEDQLTDLIAAYKPAAPKVEMNLEDPETKKLFDDAVAAGCAAIKSEFTAEITKLQALVKNGAAAAAGAGAPVPGAAPAAEKKTLTHDEFRALSHPERNTFFRDGGKLVAA
jgi:ATP-dependent protease ClpP protease subunit